MKYFLLCIKYLKNYTNKIYKNSNLLLNFFFFFKLLQYKKFYIYNEYEVNTTLYGTH